jgi:hypothetical protein
LLLQIATQTIVQVTDELRVGSSCIALGGSKFDGGAHGVGIPGIRPPRSGPTVSDQRLHEGGEPAP